MPKYITRVVLHDATYQDYENLHSFMSSAGFTTTITAQDGASYHLPPAEYLLELNEDHTAAEARDYARTTANRTGRRNAIFTAKFVSSAWAGLEKL